MPETIKKLCIEESSTITMITELNNVINSCSINFSDLIEELNIHLRHVIMGMKVIIFYLRVITFFLCYNFYFCANT